MFARASLFTHTIAAVFVAIIVTSNLVVLRSDTPDYSTTAHTAPMVGTVAATTDGPWLTGLYLLDMQSWWYTGQHAIRYATDCPQCDVYTVGRWGRVAWPALTLHWNGTGWESSLAGPCHCGMSLTPIDVVGGIAQRLSYEHHDCDGITDATGTLTRIGD